MGDGARQKQRLISGPDNAFRMLLYDQIRKNILIGYDHLCFVGYLNR